MATFQFGDPDFSDSYADAVVAALRVANLVWICVHGTAQGR